ncbi:MAG: type II toxin-antitoxin system RatA family toxin [Alphaproteobacteria bacterium TMED194]|nr:MAG: type II toxin-antitoxin system RatA family toxin [Alphaproteobacteria bacterium TMED194]
MHKYSNSIILPFSARQLYEIVIDVESYPDFLPWCLSSRIVKKTDNYNFDAELTVGYKNIDEKYISRIQAEYEKKIISKAISGPFKFLDSSWHFKNIDKKQCKVDFTIEYQFKSFFLDKVMGSLFKKATIKMLEAFEQRARSLHN